MQLARWDYASERGVVWEAYEAYEVNCMQQNWECFGTTWRMATPITSRRFRLAPVGSLTCLELNQLRLLLWDLENNRVDMEDGEILEADPDLWIADRHQA